MRSASFAISWLPAMLTLTLAGCAGPASIERGETQIAPITPAELAQSDVNRMATLGMREKYRRAVISYVQNFVGGTFLQFLPVR